MSKKVREWRTIINNRACINGSVLAGTFVQACNFNTPPQAARSPNSEAKFFAFALASGLVSVSTSMSSVGQ